MKMTRIIPMLPDLSRVRSGKSTLAGLRVESPDLTLSGGTLSGGTFNHVGRHDQLITRHPRFL